MLARPSDQTRLSLVKTVNVQEAKTHLSRLLEEAAAGEEIVIAEAGRPYVRLVPCLPEQTPRTLGGWEGRVKISDDFDQTSDEIVALFEGRGGRLLLDTHVLLWCLASTDQLRRDASRDRES